MNIATLVSGGVDSSVALKLLQDEGHSLTAFYLKIWLEEEAVFLGECPWEEDLRYVRAVCEKLNVPLRVVPLQREYYDRVISYALSEVRAGRTPNPDVMCNSFIKFGAFLEWLDSYPLGSRTRHSPFAGGDKKDFFDKVATGHYARVVQETRDKRQVVSDKQGVMQNKKLKMQNGEGITENGEQKTENKEGKMENEDMGSKLKDTGSKIRDTRYELLTSRDSVKDQTYFLSRLTQDQLGRAFFPLGPYTKKEVREMARKWDLPTKNRPDSQGLCFLGEINYRDFVKHYLGEWEGDIVDAKTGEKIARHKGHWFYTIGQRHGLDLSGGPWYVTGKDAEKNIVFISHRLKMTTVERDEFEVEDFRFLSVDLSFPRRRESSITQSGEQKSSIPACAGMTEGEAGMTEEESTNKKMKNVFVKIRHGAQMYKCNVEFLNNRKSRLRVKLLEAKERGITSGQFAVFYDGDVCFGSGVII